MSNQDEFTQQEAILFAKALAKAQAEIASLKEQLENLGETEDEYRKFWLGVCLFAKALAKAQADITRLEELVKHYEKREALKNFSDKKLAETWTDKKETE